MPGALLVVVVVVGLVGNIAVVVVAFLVVVAVGLIAAYWPSLFADACPRQRTESNS